MGFRDEREALDAKVRAQEAEIERLRAEVDRQAEPSPPEQASVEAAPEPPSVESRLPPELSRLRQEMKSERSDEAALGCLPWWVHLLAYGAVAVLAIMIAIRDCAAW